MNNDTITLLRTPIHSQSPVLDTWVASRQLDALLDPRVDAGDLAAVPRGLAPRLPHGALPPLLRLVELEAVLHPRVALHLGPLRRQALVLLDLEGDGTTLLVVVLVLRAFTAFLWFGRGLGLSLRVTAFFCQSLELSKN